MVATQREKSLYGDNIEVIDRDDDCTRYKFADKTGECVLTSYSIFEGIELVYYDVHMQLCNMSSVNYGNVLQINHCQEGRIEYELKNGEYLYLGKGDLSVQIKNDNYKYSYFPLSHYHGISIMIDLLRTPKCLSCILDDVTVSPDKLCDKFCGERSYTVMRENKGIEHIFSELYSVPENIKKGYFKVKVLELLLFLSGIEMSENREERKYFSSTQVTAAKEAKNYLTTNLEEHITITELADLLKISQTTLKICFKGVYGETIYSYIKNYKMQKAAQMLKTTDESVLEIAGAVGYSNGSKFAAAFKSVMGVTPNEYRKFKV